MAPNTATHGMQESPVRIERGEFEIDATYLAAQLRLDPAEVPDLLRSRQLTSMCEKGEGEDAGRFRLTFRLGRSRLGLVVDENGRVLRRSTIRFPRD